MKKEAFICVITLLLYVNGQICPTGWIEGPQGKKCYLFAKNHQRNWFEAQYVCQSMRAELLSVEDSTEMAWLKQELKHIVNPTPGRELEWWTSLNNQANVSNWLWTGDVPLDETVIRWGSGEPNNHLNQERCGEICCPHYFNDKSCETNINYICELNKDTSPLTCDADQGWEYHSGSCYKYFPRYRSWNDSLSDCKDLDSSLATVTDTYTHSSISMMANFQQSDPWIGLYKKGQKYYNTNSSTATEIDMFLQPNRPTINKERICMSVDGTRKDHKTNLYGDDCTKSKPFICQKPEGICKPGMIQHQSTCYYVSASTQTRKSADFFCRIVQMSLVDITSSSKATYLLSVLQKKDNLDEIWIGLKKQGNDWYWPSTGERPSLNYWANIPSEKNDSVNDCAYMSIGDGGKWHNNFACDAKLKFACESPAITSFTTVAPPTTTTIPTTVTTSASTSTSSGGATGPVTTPVLECRMNKMGLDYRGKLSTTNMGRTCQAWSVLTPHDHKFQRELITEKNYCRNPDKTPGGPWCYTTDVDQRWEFCDVPYCAGAVPPATTTTTPATVPTPRPTGLVWSSKCGMFWEDMSANSDVCHHFDERLLTWMDARQKCKDLGGNLASITSLHEQYYLTGRLKTSRYGSVWIGANSRAEDEGWRWSDESPFSFLHWMPGQPDGIENDEDCVSMDTSGMGTWEDKQCDEKLGFVCRKSVTPPVTPTLPPKSPVVDKDQMYDCQEGWMGYRSNCYFVNRTKTTWQGAVSYCRLNGAELTSIAEEGEHDFITSQLPNKFCYNTHSNDTECTLWAAKGECERNPVWMAQRCHLACNLCISDCKNLHYSVECDHWAKLGECYKNNKFMLANCALSCGVCDGAIYGGFWIGLTDKSFQMSFEWSDDTPVTYTKWSKGEPNNEFNGQTREDCIIMLLKNGYWNDVNCGTVNPGFICKKRKQVLDKVTESPFSAGCVNDSIGYDAYCYGIKDETADWFTAENICAEAPYGHLATINDRYVQAFLSSQLVGKTGSYWIGLSQDMSSGAIESWANGFPVLFTHWAKSHTGSIDEDAMCVAMTSDHPVGLWETKNCTLEKSFICEYPRTGYTTSTTTTTTTLAPTCPPGWMVYSNYCYKRLTKKMSWMKGRDYCRQLGTDLVSIHSDQEDSFIKRIMIGYSGGSEIWMGLNDRDSENGFVWSDGSPFDYSLWNPKEPNDKYDQEDCTMRSKYSSGWNDDNCYKSKKIICKVMKGIPLLEPNDTFTVEYCDAEKKWLYFNDFCYLIVRYDSQKYSDARQKCLDKNSDLLSIHSQHESNWLLEMINQRNDMWIGLNKLNRHFNSYKWSDWTPVDYIHWAENKPSASGIYRCAKISSSTGRWFDTSCMRRVPGYICKRSNDTDSIRSTPPPLPPVQGGCMSGFTRAPFNEKCYQLFKIKQSWHQANRACMAISKGSLVTIQSELEQLFVSSLLTNVDEKVWIGLTDEHSYNKYYWYDGTDLTYTNWNAKEPNGYSEHCGDMFTNIEKFGEWNDERCTYNVYYMCQTFQNAIIPTYLPGTDDCPSDYQMYNSMCYKYIETANTWNESLALCQQDGGSLVTIRNIPEKYYTNYITFNKTSPFWIGLYKVNSEDITYTWISGWPVVYTNWNPDKESPTKSCISSGTDFWTDENCDKKLPALCQVINKSPPTTPKASNCEEGGYAYKEKCYYPSLHDRLTWIQANNKCKQKGLHLSSIQDLDQIEFMINLVLKLTGSRLKLWIGLNKLGSRYAYTWSWTDESPYSFKNWNDGEPSSNSWRDIGERCVEMKSTGKWNDINCSNNERAYFCRGNPVEKEPPTTMPSAKVEETTIVIETTEATTQLQNTETKTTTPSPVVYPSGEKSISSKKIGGGTSTTLTTGQVIGIIIGLMGCVVIVFAILFVIRFNKQKGVYNTNGHSFSNALYLKTTDNITDDDPADMGSTVKICGTDTL